MEEIKARIQLRSDTEANWDNVNPELAKGELGVIVNGPNHGKMKVGNGVNSWEQLPFVKAEVDHSLLAETGAGTDITTPAVSSRNVGQILQIIWNKIRQVVNVVNTRAPITSPAFTGTPTAPTPAFDDKSTQIATMAAVHAVAGGGSIAENARAFITTYVVRTQADIDALPTFVAGGEYRIIRFRTDTPNTPSSTLTFRFTGGGRISITVEGASEVNLSNVSFHFQGNVDYIVQQRHIVSVRRLIISQLARVTWLGTDGEKIHSINNTANAIFVDTNCFLCLEHALSIRGTIINHGHLYLESLDTDGAITNELTGRLDIFWIFGTGTITNRGVCLQRGSNRAVTNHGLYQRMS